MARPRRPVADALAYAPVALLIGVSRLLPWRARLNLGAWIGRMAVTRVPRLRRRIEANLRHVLPDLTAAERARVARETGDTFGRTFTEILANPAFHARRAWTGPTGDGVAAVEAAAGTGAVLVTGHFGQWEAGRAWMKSIGITCAGVYRPADNPHLEAVYRRNLEAGGTPIFTKNARGVRGMIRHLSKGGVVAILNDQYDRRAERFDFVGRTAPTATIAADLALKFGLPLIPIYGIRDPDGEHVAVVVEAPIPHSDAATMTQAVNDSLSAMIRAHPGQYYWMHRRWEKNLPDPERPGRTI